MNSSVIYFSKTGHSKKLAEAIGKEINIPVTNINTNEKIKEADLLFIVGGIYAGKSAPEMIKYISSLDNSQGEKGGTDNFLHDQNYKARYDSGDIRKKGYRCT